MPIVWRSNVMEALRTAGYSTYYLQKKRLLSAEVCVALTQGDMVTLPTIDKICALLHCQPGDLIAYDYSDADFDVKRIHQGKRTNA